MSALREDQVRDWLREERALRIRPAKIIRHETLRPKLACPCGQGTVSIARCRQRDPQGSRDPA